MSSAAPPPTKGTELSLPYTTPGLVYSASIVLPVLGLVLVGMRLRWRVKQRDLGIDDWLILPALVGCLLPVSLFRQEIAYVLN